MALLGCRLLDGDKLATDLAEGEKWLRRAADAGETQAMRSLANRLLSSDGFKADTVEGEKWLRRAADAGETQAMRGLGIRLLDGDKLRADPAEGERWLRRAAEARSATAMANLGSRLMDGLISATDPSEAERWLRAAVEAECYEAGTNLGYLLYSQHRLPEAVEIFLAVFRSGIAFTGINLGYMLRRGEIPAGLECPPFAELLSAKLAEVDIWVTVNAALARAAGFQCVADWTAADQSFADISRTPLRDELPDVIAWWKTLAAEDDPEGHLVLAWLARHGLTPDPDGLTLPERMVRARRGPWTDAPSWLDQPAAASVADPAGQPQ